MLIILTLESCWAKFLKIHLTFSCCTEARVEKANELKLVLQRSIFHDTHQKGVVILVVYRLYYDSSYTPLIWSRNIFSKKIHLECARQWRHGQTNLFPSDHLWHFLFSSRPPKLKVMLLTVSQVEGQHRFLHFVITRLIMHNLIEKDIT